MTEPPQFRWERLFLCRYVFYNTKINMVGVKFAYCINDWASA